MIPSAITQAPNTSLVKGYQGNKLVGLPAKKGPYGGKIVESKIPVMIGSGQASSEWDGMALDQNQRNIHEWFSILCRFAR